MKKLFTIFAIAALAGCGGGGSTATPYSLTWDQASYTVTTSADSTATMMVNATIRPHGDNLPAVLAVDLSPYGGGINPTPGNGPFTMNSTGVIPVQFYVGLNQSGGAGNYPKGSYQFTATMHIGNQNFTANTTVVVQ